MNSSSGPKAMRTRAWFAPLVIFFAAFVALASLSGSRIKQASAENHFVYLADSYLHGTTEMLVPPPHGNDWATVETIELRNGDTYRGFWWDRGEREFWATTGEFYRFDSGELRGMRTGRQHYVSFPPGPAVLMVPGVLVFGMAFNDVLFTVLFGAFNVVLFYLILRMLVRTGRSALSEGDRLWLTLMFGLGTAHGWCAVLGTVWFTALVMGVTFTQLYILFATDARRPFFAGLALGCAFACRTPLLFSVVYFAVFLFFPGGKLRRDWGLKLIRDGLVFGSAPLVIGLLLMWQNYVRFDHLSEFGHSYLAAGQIDRIKEFGLFNVHFVSRNLTALFALVPKFMPHAPWVQVSQHGLAIWFTTPPLLAFFWSRYRTAENDRALRWAAFAALCAIAVPHIFYQNTGWVQFGYRFSMDYLPYLLILLAVGRDRLGWLFKFGILLGVGINAFGAVTFGRMGQYYAGWILEE
jgi:hypothetical protein